MYNLSFICPVVNFPIEQREFRSVSADTTIFLPVSSNYALTFHSTCNSNKKLKKNIHIEMGLSSHRSRKIGVLFMLAYSSKIISNGQEIDRNVLQA